MSLPQFCVAVVRLALELYPDHVLNTISTRARRIGLAVALAQADRSLTYPFTSVFKPSSLYQLQHLSRLIPSRDLADIPSRDLADIPSRDLADMPSRDLADIPSRDLADIPFHDPCRHPFP